MKGLAVLQHWDSPAVRQDGKAGVLVDHLGHRFGIVGKVPAREEMDYGTYKSFGIVPLVPFIDIDELGTYLAHFLLKGHPAKQILHPLLNRLVLIPVQEVALLKDRAVPKVEAVFARTKIPDVFGPGNIHMGQRAFRHLDIHVDSFTVALERHSHSSLDSRE